MQNNSVGRPPREDRSTVRTKALPVIRCTEEEDAELRAGAEADGKPIGTWLRELGMKRRAQQLKSPRK